MKIKVLSYVDRTDDTKGILCAVNADTDLHTQKMQDKVFESIKPFFSADGEFICDDPMDVVEIARQICFTLNNEDDVVECDDYEFFFEETELLN